MCLFYCTVYEYCDDRRVAKSSPSWGDDLEIEVVRDEVQLYILSYFKSVVHLLFTVDIATSY